MVPCFVFLLCSQTQLFPNTHTAIQFSSAQSSSELMKTRKDMQQFHSFFFFLLSPFFIPSLVHAISFVAPINKDNSTLLYSLPLYLKTPLQPTHLHLDLGASFSWVVCDTDYNSSTYQHIPCGSPLCTSLGHTLSCSYCYKPPSPSCGNETCSVFPENPVTRKTALSTALTDSLALPTSDGSVQGPPILFPAYIFSCSPPSLLQGLANDVTGLAAFGRSNYSLPAQISNKFSVPRYFALCLSGTGPGVALFGSVGPYYFSSQKIDLSKSLIYTPLILSPVGSTVITYAGEPSDEYYINVTSFNVNGKPIQINTSLLTVDENGFGGTKLSTATPYTILETSFYNALTEAFVNESSGLNLTVTKAVKPFSVCYSAADVIVTRVGPGVPTIDLVMQSDDVFWRVFGSNSMVRIAGGDGGDNDVWCLGFVDGGVNPRTSVVIGGHQLEDNLLQFDLGSKRLGFTSSALLKGTACSDFNFGS